ncbi:DNA-binding response regulator [Pullulanibacillus camelliae]|uniref:DNA-binding response regulator n=1 Tax=Pullulanibacillus camelliae TaxID=1707096 RepID=A0A8J2VJ10_9BACL|nr:response regulator [Pullulanibacillus camelliae]GGE26085.1 DNA-binding response regulator [Pullulanibacillus camelliae]
MMKMIIVDDEPIIIQGLRETIPWDTYGIEIVDVASNGREALEKVRQYAEVQIVLTDVKMPIMDGLELAEQLQNRPNAPKVIMLSGYDEFDYAKTAIRLGVKDYLLKPVDVDELLQTVDKVKKTIVSEQSARQQFNQLQMKDVMAHVLFATPFEHASPSFDIGTLSVLPILSSMKQGAQLTRELQDSAHQRHFDQWQTLISSLVDQRGSSCASLYIEDNLLLTCIYCLNDKTPNMLKIIEQLKVSLESHLRFHFIVSNQIIPIKRLPEVKMKMVYALEKLYIEEGTYSVLTEESRIREESKELPHELEEAVIRPLQAAEAKELNEGIEVLFAYLKQQRFLLTEVCKCCHAIEKRIGKLYGQRSSHYDVSTLELAFTQEVNVHRHNSYESLKALFEEDMRLIFAWLHPDQKNHHHWLIDRAMSYIQDYYKYDVKATEVADYINISPNYFSVLFKQYTHMSFNEYLNHLRVEKAKSLLEETSDKVTAIAEQVGYQNYKYFVQVFKQLTMMTPTEYRRFLS